MAHTAPEGWRQATREEFYVAMSGDVHPKPVTPWPYASHFETRGRHLVGVVLPAPTYAGDPTYHLPPER